MTNHIDKVFSETAGKSAFVCVSCGHNNIIGTDSKSDKTSSQIKDRFTEAVAESAEKSAFACASCHHIQQAS